MAVQTYSPEIQVTLFKMVARTNGKAGVFGQSNSIVDLTPYLGDAGGVRTSKALTEPAGGFSLTFPDQPETGTGDTIYSLIEPMDMIEIRASRTPAVYAGGKLPLIMRGFVSVVRRAEAMTEDNKPQRYVVVQGQDFGKLWLIHGFWPEIVYAEDLPTLSTFGLLSALGLTIKVMPISDFMTELTEKVMNLKITDLQYLSGKEVAPFKVDATVKHGSIIPPVANSIVGGPFWNMAEKAADRPWNELFIEDREDGPYLVFRPAPFKGTDGKLILPDAADPGTIELDDSAVVSIDPMRSDQRVANFFWVPPAGSALDSSFMVNVSTLISRDLLDFSNGDNDPKLYGEKKMEVGSILVPETISELPTMLPNADRQKAAQSYIQWHLARAIQLRDMNRDNSVFEEGEMTLQGWETIRIGRYLRLTRGQIVSEAYITRVDQIFIPFQRWTTHINFERGTGFLERNKYEGRPFYAEGRRGPYIQ